MGAAAMLVAGVWLVTSAYAEKGQRGMRHGPPPCTDPVPAERQEKLLAEFGAKDIDADKDGTLTCAEIKAFFDANPSLRPHHPHGPPPCADPMPADMQEKLLAEFGEKGIDADKDGTLTCAEIQAFFKANPPPKPSCPAQSQGKSDNAKSAGGSSKANTSSKGNAKVGGQSGRK